MRNIHTYALIMGLLVQIYNMLAYRRAMRNTCSHNGTPCPKFAFSVVFFSFAFFVDLDKDVPLLDP